MNEKEMIDGVLSGFQRIKELSPLIHVIPNSVSASFCADGIKALGGRPIMALCKKETKEITSQSKAVVYNLGQPDKEKWLGIERSMEAVLEKNIPVVLDPVGVSASLFRKQMIMNLIEMPWCGVIKGNSDEINTILNGTILHNGVDSLSKEADFSYMKGMKEQIGEEKVVAITGTRDFIVHKDRSIIINHIEKNIKNLVGTGCLAGCLIGTFLAVTDSILAAVGGLGIMGLVNDHVNKQSVGYGSRKSLFLDIIETVTSIELENYLWEVLEVET